MLLAPILSSLLACSDAGDDTAGALDCELFGGELALPDRVKPGDQLTLSAPADPAATLTWSADRGDVADSTWTVPADIAVHVDEEVAVQVDATLDGCPDQRLSATITVGWEDADRVVVVHNPSVSGSDTVAAAYGELHGLTADQHCAIETSETVTLAGDDLEAFVDALQTCITTVGPQVHYVVPVHGVPYKLSGRIDDIGGGGAVTTSLDAMLALGPGATAYDQAIYNPLWQEGDSLAGAYDPYVPFGQWRAGEDDAYYLVARIDGADVDAALALVERSAVAAALAQEGQLAGTVYVDGRYGDDPPATDEFGSYESGEWNMWGTRTLFQDLSWYDVVWDGNSEEFGTAPAPETCPDALYYAGWYSYYNYNDAFTWAPGAIGGHLDSCSACDIRAEGTWVGSALQRGITATFGAVAEPYVAGMPEYDQLFRYLTQGASYGEAAYESTRISLWMMVFVGDPLYRPYPAD